MSEKNLLRAGEQLHFRNGKLALHDFHAALGARFTSVNGAEAVSGYGDVSREHNAIATSSGLIDLSFRSRICLTGSDRARFLHGQVTNEVRALRPGEGCYAALITAKGRMQSDFNIYCLQDELLLDFEPGLTAAVSERLEKYVIADDVQIVDVAPHYGLLSAQGPQATALVIALGLTAELPANPFGFVKITDSILGELYLMNRARVGTSGFDLFIPTSALSAMADKLSAAAKSSGAIFCGWEAFETSRIEAGIPRFSADMDESNIRWKPAWKMARLVLAKGVTSGRKLSRAFARTARCPGFCVAFASTINGNPFRSKVTSCSKVKKRSAILRARYSHRGSIQTSPWVTCAKR